MVSVLIIEKMITYKKKRRLLRFAKDPGKILSPFGKLADHRRRILAGHGL